jgi:hypothetical protein
VWLTDFEKWAHDSNWMKQAIMATFWGKKTTYYNTVVLHVVWTLLHTAAVDSDANFIKQRTRLKIVPKKFFVHILDLRINVTLQCCIFVIFLNLRQRIRILN